MSMRASHTLSPSLPRTNIIDEDAEPEMENHGISRDDLDNNDITRNQLVMTIEEVGSVVA